MASLFTVNADGSLSITIPPQKIANGTLAQLPAAPGAGDVFVALDQPLGQQLYVCGKPGQWNQMLNLGGSGALTLEGGSLDINLAIVPRLDAANTWKGLNQFKDASFSGTVTGLSQGPNIWCGASSATAQPVVARVDKILSFETESAGSTPGVQTTPTQFTIPSNGLYRGYAQMRTIPAVVGAVYLILKRNGQEIAENGWAGGPLGGPVIQAQFSLPLLKGDVLTVTASSWSSFNVETAAFFCEA